MSALATLQSALKAFSMTPLQGTFDLPEQLMSYTRELEARFGSASVSGVRPERMTLVLRRLLASGEIETVQDLRYACYGLWQEVGPSRQRVIATPAACIALFKRLNDVVDDKRRLRRCYQGLLATYFAFDGLNAEEPARTQWRKVRGFLREHFESVASQQPIPQWVQLLGQHQNLFGDTPCDRYSKQLLTGDRVEFDEVIKGLGIPDQSWLVQEAACATIRAACDLPHGEFRAKVPVLVNLLKKHTLIQNRGLANILIRYAEVPGRPEEPLLLQISLSWWHNPLFNRNLVNWHLAGDKATRMVTQWLKSTLIEDFFEHLSVDGATDKRRVKFWKRYVNSIGNMYFALGGRAARSRDADVTRLRGMMGDNMLFLDGGAPSNNGFFMVMKDRVIAEFGEKGNAVYVFHQDHLPWDLAGTISGVGKRDWQELQGAHHLRHDDNVHGYGGWEDRFEEFLKRTLNIRPDEDASQPEAPVRVATRPTVAPSDLKEIRAFCARRGVPFNIDAADSMLIARIGATNSPVTTQLKTWGFTYSNPKARWERRF